MGKPDAKGPPYYYSKPMETSARQWSERRTNRDLTTTTYYTAIIVVTIIKANSFIIR
jgi:hypothetical protein